MEKGSFQRKFLGFSFLLVGLGFFLEGEFIKNVKNNDFFKSHSVLLSLCFDILVLFARTFQF